MTIAALSSIAIGSRIAKNRIAVSAHSSGLMCPNGNSDKLHAYVESRAWGGVGLFVLGETLVHDGAELAGEAWGLAVSQPGIESVYMRLASTAQAHDMLLIDQLSHLGGQVWATPGAQAFAPSSVAHPISGVVPAALLHEQFRLIEKAYVDAAKRAVEGGIHGVEIKCDQGKLLHQFLSSHFNRRSDEYGGDTTGRVEFPLRIASAIRAAVPENFIVGVRLTLQGYPSMEEAADTTEELLRAAGADYVSVSADTNSTYRGYLAGHGGEESAPPSIEDAVRAVRAITGVPVMIAGKVQTLEQADALIVSGKADIVAMTRAHIADPAIVRKYNAGETYRVRPCISCNQSCVGNTWEGREVRCIHNAEAGREINLSDRGIQRAIKPLRIAIIGGGPAGLEAARVAGRCGHHVELFEAGDRLGGQLLTAQLRPGSSRLGEVVTHLEGEVRRMPNVAVSLCRPIIDGRQAELQNVDSILVAIGSRAMPPTIQNGTRILSAGDALTCNLFKNGDRVLVVDEDWIQNGLGIAIALLNKGVRPEIITTRETTGWGLNVVTLVSQLATLRSSGVPISTLTAFGGISEDATTRTIDLCTGQDEDRGTFAAVVLVENRQPNRLDLSANNARIWHLGDCVFPRGLEYAILEGNRTARIGKEHP